MQYNYQKTIYACFIGYIVQAIVNNFAPLLFLTFQSTYHIPLSQITLLVTFNFGLQLIVDLVCARVIDRVGYRVAVLFAHFCAAVGLVSLAVLPRLLPSPFLGLLISILIYAIGGGIIEVLISPIVEACPTDHKEKAMSLLHSFYCWGHVGVVLISTLFFAVFGIHLWPVLAVLWALVPALNFFLFSKVPIAPLLQEGETGLSVKQLVRKKQFWIFLVLMVCAGASEQAVSQWASTFAEQGLQVSKTIGDLTGPMLFAIMMGLSRVIYGKYGDRIDLTRFMLCSAALCIGSYLLISCSPVPFLSLIGCGICGFSVGILWPGTFSLAASSIRGGGTAMFAFFALAGDLGCSTGPTFVGMISDLCGGRLHAGILAGVVFPLVMLTFVLWNQRLQSAAPIQESA